MVESNIIQVFTSSGMTRVEFANRLGISNAVLSHLASGRNKASLDLVIAILNHFPKINAEWLILNKGEMYKSEIDDKQRLKTQLLNRVEALKSTNQSLNKLIVTFEEEIKDLK